MEDHWEKLEDGDYLELQGNRNFKYSLPFYFGCCSSRYNLLQFGKLRCFGVGLLPEFYTTVLTSVFTTDFSKPDTATCQINVNSNRK